MIKSAAFGSTFSVLLLIAVLRYVFSGFGADDHYPGTKDSHSEDFEPLHTKRSFDTYQCKIKRFFGVVELPKYFAEVVQAKTTTKPELEIIISDKLDNLEKSVIDPEEVTTNPQTNTLDQTVTPTIHQITADEVLGVQIEPPREDGQLFLGEEEKEYICCYKDPRNPTKHVGRPFLVTPHIKQFWPKYMKSKVISKADKQTLYPTPATGASSNHFREHLTHIDQTMKFFPGKKIVFYDLGLTPGEVEYLKKHNETYIYREFEYDKYPEHIRHLKNYAWKVLIWSELIQK